MSLASHRRDLRGNIVLLILGTNGSLQGDFAILGDDLDVVGVRRQRLVLMNGHADFLRDFAIGLIHLLLIGGRSALVFIALVCFCIVRWGLLGIALLLGGLRHQGGADLQQTTYKNLLSTKKQFL